MRDDRGHRRYRPDVALVDRSRLGSALPCLGRQFANLLGVGGMLVLAAAIQLVTPGLPPLNTRALGRTSIHLSIARQRFSGGIYDIQIRMPVNGLSAGFLTPNTYCEELTCLDEIKHQTRCSIHATRQRPSNRCD